MEELVRQRIKSVLSYKNTSMTKLAGNGTPMQLKLSRQINKGSSITFDVIYFILQSFPDVSAEWLIRGKGTMLCGEESKSIHIDMHKDGNVTGNGNNVGNTTTNEGNEDLLSIIKQQQKQISELIAKL